MPRLSSTTIVDFSGPQMTPLDEIPQDVIDYVEEVYAKQRKTRSRERAIYDTEAELKTEFKLMADYVAQRPKEKGGILRIRKSPTRKENLPEDLKAISDRVMDFRITADLEANGAANANADNGAKATASNKK